METLDERFVDPDIERALKWLMSFLPSGEWESRKASIEHHLDALLKPRRPGPGVSTEFSRLIGTDDRIGWYLYLVECSLYEPYRSEVNQAARVLPVFKRLGIDLDSLQSIGRIEEKARHLLAPKRAQPDAVLFEMLVALLWVRNGWDSVEFIPEDRSERRPDIKVTAGEEVWFVGTKRMTANSEYSQKERGKWLTMWGKFKDVLVSQRLLFIFEVTFHVEIESLPDDFLLVQLKEKLKLITGPCMLISNDTWDVEIRLVDFEKIKAHLSNCYVKHPSRQLQELIGGRWDRSRGFTMAMYATLERMGGERGVNQYVSDLDWAAGAYWCCDSTRANEKKARDIRGHLAEAVRQLPASGRGVIHVGLETWDGEDVEVERADRITNTVAAFDPDGKDLRWIYCHLFESYAPPETSWAFDETIYRIGLNTAYNAEPLALFTCVSSADDWQRGPHWLREAP